MPVSDAQKKASMKYLEKLDEVRIRMPKGRKAIIQDYAAAIGESVNSYINGAIDDRMAQEADGPVCTVPVSPGTFYAATEAAEAHGESVNGFINRAIIETIDRDRQAPPGGIGESG